MNVVIPIQHGGYTIRSWLYLKSSWLYPNIVVVITKLLCQIEFYQWLAQYDTDRCVSCFVFDDVQDDFIRYCIGGTLITFGLFATLVLNK